MKMKSQRKLERDRARREARDRVRRTDREAALSSDDGAASETELDVELARRLRGYDA